MRINKLSYYTIYHLTIVVIPWAWTEDSYPPLFGPIDKAVPGVRVEPRNVHVVVAAQHRRDVSHGPALVHLVHRRHGMVGRMHRGIVRFVVDFFHVGFSDAVSNQTKVGTRRKFHARDGRGLGAVERLLGEGKGVVGLTLQVILLLFDHGA